MTDRAVLQEVALQEVVKALTEAAVELRLLQRAALPDTRAYPTIRREYRLTVYEAVVGYLDSDLPIARFKNAMRRAVVDHFPEAFYAGYAEAGGEETEDEDERWLTVRMNQELGFVDDLFSALKDKRGSVDAEAEAEARADGYAGGLDAIYSEGMLRGLGNKMLTWHLGETEVHCSTCSGLDGKRHGAKWWVKNEYIPRQPGSKTLECGGYNCECRLVDDKGNEFTV